MNLDPPACYRALAARDPRFDGVFYVAVTSTGIYCRPVCPARTPAPERCRFFPSAAAAEQARFRPCLRCRPELAPGNAPIDAVSRTAKLAASRISAAIGMEDAGLEEVAAELGIGSRHLRRVLRRALGVSPIELAQTHRLLLAKQLLTETSLPITRVAFDSGFASVRRFNALFRSRYRLTPSDLRRSSPDRTLGESIRLTLSYRPPFAWNELLDFLAPRALTGVEAIVGRTYLRTVVLGELRGWLKVEPVANRHTLALELPEDLTGALPQILARLRGLFDLDARPDLIASHLGHDPHVGRRVRNKPGLRVAGAFDGFELAVRAILGQQVSVRAATTLAGRFAAAFGQPTVSPFPALTRFSPLPARVAEAKLEELTGIGLVAARAECVRTLARAVCDKKVSLVAEQDPEAFIERLTALPGIGPWTAHYVAMRGLRWPDAFPHSDLGLGKALGGRSASEMLGLAEGWRPWRAYAAMHLWDGLAAGEIRRGA